MTKLEVGSTYITVDNDEICIITINEYRSKTYLTGTYLATLLLVHSKVSGTITVGKDYTISADSDFVNKCQLFLHPIPANIEELPNLYPEYFL